MLRAVCAASAMVAAGACARGGTVVDEHGGHAAPAAATPAAPATGQVAYAAQSMGLPAGNAEAAARLAASPRHNEEVMIGVGPGDSVRAWVAYPQRSTKAPVVVVIHEIYGYTTWLKAVADQLAADGFIAIFPDMLTGKIDPSLSDSVAMQATVAAIRALPNERVNRILDATGRYGMALPAALPRYGVVGFCWGGARSFLHAAHSPTLGAAVVYYGSSPPSDTLRTVRAPVLGLYGGNDMRVNATIPPADSAMKALGKTFEPHIFPGAGHGFLRQQTDSANLAATRQAWPLTIGWFRRYLGG